MYLLFIISFCFFLSPLPHHPPPLFISPIYAFFLSFLEEGGRIRGKKENQITNYALLDPDGEFVEALGRQHSPEAAAKVISAHIGDRR